MNLQFTLFLSILTLLCSCKNTDSSPPPSPAVSRDVKYELTGTASGQFTNISVIYIAASGTALSEDKITLPWSKTLKINDNVAAITFQTAVSGATPNQTITAKIIVGGVVKVQETALVASNGIATLALPGYIF